MKILIIGHEGYLGQGLVSYLSKKNEIVGWDIKDDLFNLTSKTLFDKRIEVVINLSVAADLSTKTFQVDAPGDIINVEGAKHLARILKGSEIFWFQISTREVFRNVYTKDDVYWTESGYRPKFFVDESQPYSPQNFYGKSKVISEFITESHPFGNVIRLTSPYTDHDHSAGGWVLKLTKSILKGNPIKLTSGGNQFRDPLHTDDLGSLIESLCSNNIVNEKLHAGGGNNNLISLKEFVQLIDSKYPFETEDGNDFGFAFDNSKAFSLTDWQPKVLIREKISEVINNVRKSLGK